MDIILDKKKVYFEQYFPTSYSSDMEDLAMTCIDFMNALKMLICSEKHQQQKIKLGSYSFKLSLYYKQMLWFDN